MAIRDIAGRQNHSIKLARKLQKKKCRREQGLLVAEGLDLLVAAVEAGADIREVLVRQDLLTEVPQSLVRQAEQGLLGIGVCSPEVLGAASSLGGGTDVVFVSRRPAWSLGEVGLGPGFCVYLEGVGDPGNVGTLVRSCTAFGAVGMICSPGTADPYGPKAMRAGMGAQFVLPVVTEVTPADLLAHLEGTAGEEARPPSVVVTDPRGDWDIADLPEDLLETRGLVVVLGSERTGPGQEWADRPRLRIAQERFDSLNVAMAGTIVLYELHRRAVEKQG